MSAGQLEDVAHVCNRYPDIQLTYQLPTGTSTAAGEQVTLVAELERELEGDLRPVDAPRCTVLLVFQLCDGRSSIRSLPCLVGLPPAKKCTSQQLTWACKCFLKGVSSKHAMLPAYRQQISFLLMPRHDTALLWDFFAARCHP